MYFDDWDRLDPPVPPDPAEEMWAAVIFTFLVIVIAIALSGCRVALPASEAPFDVKAPAFAFAGDEIRIACYVPESLGAGTIRLALEGAAASGPRPLEHAQTSLVISRVECGRWLATCSVSCEGGTRYAERVVEVRGGMCDGQGFVVPAR